MTKQLTTQNATITTASIQMNTLTVSGKQVTLAVFRQLRDQDVIAHDGTINGIPWGNVNYHPDKCEAAPEHLHTVWQLGDQLRRAYVRTPLKAHLQHRLAGLYAMALIAEGASSLDRDSGLRCYRGQDRSAWALVNARGVSFKARIPIGYLLAWEATGWDAEAKRAAIETEVRALRPSAEIKEELPVDAYNAAWRALNDLPQLFIAV